MLKIKYFQNLDYPVNSKKELLKSWKNVKTFLKNYISKFKSNKKQNNWQKSEKLQPIQNQKNSKNMQKKMQKLKKIIIKKNS